MTKAELNTLTDGTLFENTSGEVKAGPPSPMSVNALVKQLITDTFTLSDNNASDISTSAPILGSSNLEVILGVLAAGIGTDTHLILTSLRNFATNPMDDGDTFTVATTLPEDTRFERVWMLSSGLAGTPTEMDGSIYIKVGIQTDQPIAYGDLDIANESSISYGGTLPTTVINRNILFTVVGGSITAGTLDKVSFLILK